MANQPESRGSENRGNSHTEQRGQQSGTTSQTHGEQQNMRDSSSQGQNDKMKQGSQTGQSGKCGQTGSQHTNAGNTGTGSGQISPKTQNEAVPGRTPSREDSKRKH